MRLHQDATTLSADRKDSVRFKNYSQPLDESDNYIIRPQSAISCSNVSNRSDPPLTSTDALLIADTFRQRMRRPEWQQAQDPAHSKEFLSEEDARQKQEEQEEEERRKKLSQELLKKELAAEGTLMKKVGKRANLSAIIYHADELK
ncbi:uncharacterized protein BYT42DRAFT_375570 [Radiomyces spectabilis]|uniref:uncharacterized protein n=1 Tax=Radiomyces spectabilis TaxID=64574 RepID=UPI00221F7BB2|nr:uncharacterized protein BYT42DRAFT_375570 [Radiomyces spectabilis]KAI8376120.1 hypothetical protein BYT42DRAFT_375570 [Radiomyces spectabilis]